jgi:FKBP-type peptidyl-prolyl cis-trans isomerase FklB
MSTSFFPRVSLLLLLATTSGLGTFSSVRADAPAATQPATQPATLTTSRQRASYLIGFQFGMEIRQHGVDVDIPALSAAVSDALAGKQPQLTPQQIKDTIAELQKANAAKQAADAAPAVDPAIATKNKADGAAFLAANAKKEGVVTDPAGWQYKVVTSGHGKQPVASDTVTVNYKGTFLDGSVFDQSQAGAPATFPIENLIPAWKDALVKMHEGDHWIIYVPSDLAYGPDGSGPIPPNATLIFDMELLKVK